MIDSNFDFSAKNLHNCKMCSAVKCLSSISLAAAVSGCSIILPSIVSMRRFSIFNSLRCFINLYIIPIDRNFFKNIFIFLL
uniref:Uncharacterized protein n=1 Tax=Glossina brevipalpis TaxID=37001 RepID=A0A1A9X5J1_9MUSC